MLLAVAQGIGACLEERVDGVLMNTSELGGRLSPAIYFEILAFAFAARSREGLKEREEGRKGVELERIVVAAIVEKISHGQILNSNCSMGHVVNGSQIRVHSIEGRTTLYTLVSRERTSKVTPCSV